jgi:hypothetical protein
MDVFRQSGYLERITVERGRSANTTGSSYA